MLGQISPSTNQELWNARHVIGYWPQDWQTFYDNLMENKPILGEVDEEDRWLYDIAKELERCHMVKKRGVFWKFGITIEPLVGLISYLLFILLLLLPVFLD